MIREPVAEHYEKMFVCPSCGNTFFGTEGVQLERRYWTGYCKSQGCGFRWSRAEDAQFFFYMIPVAEVES